MCVIAATEACLSWLSHSSHNLTAVCGLLGVSDCYRPESARVGYFVPSLLTLAWHILRLRLPQHLAIAYFNLVACGCMGRRIAMGQNWPSDYRGCRNTSAGSAPVYPDSSQGEIDSY